MNNDNFREKFTGLDRAYFRFSLDSVVKLITLLEVLNILDGNNCNCILCLRYQTCWFSMATEQLLWRPCASVYTDCLVNAGYFCFC